MGNRLNEDEKTEVIIRGLLRLPDNRRCINCNSLGPQYVCTTFFTFVCTSCSGVHREFTHRVKSVSMAKFSAEEVSSLQAGGNERARRIYFKEWDPQRNLFPDGSNLQRLREFIKHVYVDRKYTGERSMGLPRLRLSEKEERSETRKPGAHLGRSKSLYDDDKPEQLSSARGKNDNRSVKYYYDERRSPRYYSQENSRSRSFKRNPIRFEVVDDRFRDEGSGHRRFSFGESKVQSRSPDRKKNMERSRSPVMRHLREILGENIPSLRVGPISKANNGKDSHGSAEIQKKSLPDNQESAPVDPVECEKINSESLIDFSAEPEAQDNTLTSQPQQICSSDNSNNWASFESPAIESTPQPPRRDTLENLLFELSVPSAAPADCLALPGPASQTPELLSSDAVSSTPSMANAQEKPSLPGPPQTLGSNGATVKDTERQLVGIQQKPFPSLKAFDSFTSLQTTPVGALNYESRTSSAPLAQRSLSFSAENLSHSVSISALAACTGAEFRPLQSETRYTLGKGLPVELFTASYSSTPAPPVSGWQTAPSPGMGVNMQYYPNAMPVPTFPSSAKSSNPFDINDDRSLFQTTSLPSMDSLQAALPDVSSPKGLMRSSSLGTNLAQLNTPYSPSNSTMLPPQSPSFGSAISPGAYMGQQVHWMPSRPQGTTGGLGTDRTASGFSLNTTQRPTNNGGYSATGNQSPFYPMGGNPFV